MKFFFQPHGFNSERFGRAFSTRDCPNNRRSLVGDFDIFLKSKIFKIFGVFLDYSNKAVICSKSAIKYDTLQTSMEVLDIRDTSIERLDVASGVNDQPMGQEEGTKGAKNRLTNAQNETKNAATLYVSIENYIEEVVESGKKAYYDKAVVACSTGRKTVTAESDAVRFPNWAVEKAKATNFKETAGKIMERSGIVTRHNDPHLVLAGKPR